MSRFSRPTLLRLIQCKFVKLHVEKWQIFVYNIYIPDYTGVYIFIYRYIDIYYTYIYYIYIYIYIYILYLYIYKNGFSLQR